MNFPLSINKVLYCIALYCIVCAGFAYRLCVHVCVQFVFVVCVCVCVLCVKDQHDLLSRHITTTEMVNS